MNNSQKNYVVPLLLVIIILLIAFGGYFIYTQRAQNINQGQVTIQSPSTTANNGTQNQNQPLVPSANPLSPVPSANPNSPGALTTDWLNYSNQEFGFQMKYPFGTGITSTDITGGQAVHVTFPVSVKNFAFVFPQLEIDIQSKQYQNGVLVANIGCDDGSSNFPSTPASVNDIQFEKTDVSNQMSGMQSASIAVSYCAIHNGIRYKVIPRVSFDRNTGVSPDRALSLQQFDQVVSALNFQFLDQPKGDSEANHPLKSAVTK